MYFKMIQITRKEYEDHSRGEDKEPEGIILG